MKKRRLTLSEAGIWMNETAFPGEAVNTIGFRLYLPTRSAEELKNAANAVMARTALFRLRLEMEGDTPYLVEELQQEARCIYGKSLSREGAEALWEQETAKHLTPASTRFLVRPVTEGGAVLIALFHHLIIDGHSLTQMGQMILNEVCGIRTRETEIRFSETSGFEAAGNGDGPEAGTGEKQGGNPEEKRFWTGYFDGLNAEASLLPGEPENCRRTGHTYALPEDLSSEIEAYARLIGVPESSVLGAAFSLYLARAGRTRDAVLLMPRLNRDTPEERVKMGCFTLVAPVRTTVRDEMTFAELCRSFTERARSASAHKKYGMKNILTDLQNAGIVSGSLSEYAFNYHKSDLHSEIPFSFAIGNGGAMHNHMTVSVSRFGKTLEICYDTRDGIYTKESAVFFHEAFLAILKEGIKRTGPTGGMEILGDREKALLLHMEGKKIPVSETASIPDLLRRAAEKYADRPALYAGEVSLSFSELDRLSNRIARALIDCGVTPGTPVMYKLRRDYRLIPAMFGILKTGAAFIPIDPQYPEDRINYIQRDSGASWMIVNHEAIPAAGETDAVPGEEAGAAPEGENTGFSGSLLDIDRLMAFPDDSGLSLKIPQNQLAYSIYTSGTTGRPKGVLLSHRGIVNITHPDNNPFTRDIVRCGTGIVAIGSVCFDISLFEFLVPLFNGMFIEFAPESALADPRAIAALLSAHHANILHLTPSRLQAYLHESSFSESLVQVEAILAAGEVLPGSLVNELKDRYGIRIYNGYGPTEATIGATITEAGDNRTIGSPIANTGILILDGAGRLVPFGAAGELCIYGKGVGIGYRNRPEETEKHFTVKYGKRIYRTGDLGRFLPDGRIDYLGRSDFQVKLRGLRIELPEIENSILSMDGIGSAAVQIRKISGSEHLAAFYTLREGSAVTEAALKQYLEERLTFYMVPDLYKELEEIPQTPGGKTDLNALAAIPLEKIRIYRAPGNSYEKAICEAFSTVLESDRIGIDDNFFELGGDSLHTAELVMEIEKRLPGVSVKYEDIFHYPIPELLSQHLYREAGNTSPGGANLLKPLDYAGIRQLLLKNEAGEKPELHSLGNILITGVPGFLGVHILLELLKNPDKWEKIYCLIRPTKRQDAVRRLKMRLMFFDEQEALDAIGERIFPLEGNVENPELFDAPFGERIDTVINCAADVSHFAYDDKLERTNTGGVRNLINFCRKEKAAFIQISTISVGGVSLKGRAPLTLTEQNLYIGQEIRNQYIHSKYMAEYAALRAAVDFGIPVKIMRVGNLQGRLSDGEFQVKKSTNAFTRQLLSYAEIGCVPLSLYDGSVNFSPVDEVARMIVALSLLPEEYTVFHIYPPQEVPFNRLFSSLAELGFPVEVVTDEEFAEKIRELRTSEHGRALAEGILVERSDVRFQQSEVKNDFTQKMLSQLRVFWKPITDGYLNQYLKALVEMQIFKGELK